MSSTRWTNKQVLTRVGAVCTLFFAGWTWTGWQLHTRCMDTANAMERRIAHDIGWVEEKDGKLVCLAEDATGGLTSHPHPHPYLNSHHLTSHLTTTRTRTLTLTPFPPRRPTKPKKD